MTRPADAEQRLLRAVMCVLAGCGPGDAKAPGPPPEEVVPATTQPATMPSPPANAQTEPEAFCRAYAQSVVATPARRPADRPVARGLTNTSYWDEAAGVVRCQIVRAQVAGTIQVTESMTCCRDCPPPEKVDVPGFRQTVEAAAVRPDGVISESRIQVLTFPEHESQPHNCGRRPEGFAPERVDPAEALTGVARNLAEMALLERASVGAFERLALELRAHGAPDELVDRALAARDDEVRHAAMVGELADRHGAPALGATESDLRMRTLREIAIENAIEGCVREAYGALVATYQASRAAPPLRATFLTIATDERRHASLAEDVDAWLQSRIDGEDRRDVAIARDDARRELFASVSTARGCDVLGLPAAPVARALLDAYFG